MPISCYDSESFEPGLRYEEAIERISMMQRERSGGEGVMRQHVQRVEAGALQRLGQPLYGRSGQLQPPGRLFDADLPQTSNADDNLVLRCSQSFSYLGGKLFRPKQDPEQHMGIGKQSQTSPSSKSRIISSGVSSKSGAIHPCPAH